MRCLSVPRAARPTRRVLERCNARDTPRGRARALLIATTTPKSIFRRKTCGFIAASSPVAAVIAVVVAAAAAAATAAAAAAAGRAEIATSVRPSAAIGVRLSVLSSAFVCPSLSPSLYPSLCPSPVRPSVRPPLRSVSASPTSQLLQPAVRCAAPITSNVGAVPRQQQQ